MFGKVLSVLLLCLKCEIYDATAKIHVQTQPLSSSLSQGQHTGLYTGPYFSGVSLSKVMNLTAVLGHTVHLPCHVQQLGTNTLAWVRKRDSSILSVDTDIVTHDKRFRIVESEDREDWVLIIRGVTTDDAGYYECQISTEQKMSRFVHLKVIVPITRIDGAPDIFAKSGSSVDITCTVTDSATSSLIWYKDGNIIPVEDWNDVSVTMKKENKSVISVLTINSLSQQRFGIYSCRPDGLSLHNVTLHVIDAKEQGLRTNEASKFKNDIFFLLMIIYLQKFCYEKISCPQ